MNIKDRLNILVVIAARGNSKGLKNKNIKRLIDRPLIAYTILQSMKWGKATNIICSTDSKKIAAAARRYGAEVPFIRPRYLSGDNIAKIEVLRHALIRCETIYKKRYDIIVDLDVTSPIRQVSDLDRCLEIFKKQKPKTLFSVVRSRKNPYFNMVEKKGNGRITLCKTRKKSIVTRQAAPIVYDMNASIYFYRRDYLLNEKNTTAISEDSIAYVMNGISSVDIDMEIDFKFVEFLIRKGIWKSEV